MSRPEMRRGPAATPPAGIDLDALLKRLHLANARRAWRELVLRLPADTVCRALAVVAMAGRRR